MSQGAISKEAKWMAVYTKPRCEKKAFEKLSKREDLELYLPLQKRLKQWSDRKKWVEEVVLPSYLFIKCTEKQRYDILQEVNVLNFVFWLGKPAVIKDGEIQALKDFLGNVRHIDVEMKQFERGQKVVIAEGPLKEKSGTVVSISKNQVGIQLESLGILLIAKVNPADVQLAE